MLVELFQAVLIPVTHTPRIKELFPVSARFASDVPDVVLDRILLPVTRATAWLFSWSRYLQQGNIHAYLFYIILVLFFLFMWK
jgi:hypothetical protein